jgi:starch synthase
VSHTSPEFTAGNPISFQLSPSLPYSANACTFSHDALGGFGKMPVMSALKLCVLSSEIFPYAKTGGLADVAGALLQNLRLLGHEVYGFMPLYSAVRTAHQELQPVLGIQKIPLSIGTTEYRFSLQTASFPGTDIAMYFVDCPLLFDRAAFYTTDPDEHRRFLLFTRAALESCRRLGIAPDIFHCNDWHTAFLPLYLKTLYSSDPLLARARSVLTIHNIGYQGTMPSAAADDLGVDAAESQLDADDLAQGVINPLKNGIKLADIVTTVSPTYAREIREGPLGMGMQATLRARTDQVVGILNGVDYRDWDPRSDPHLTAHFGPQDLRGKRTNKEMLLADSHLDMDLSRPLVGMVTRLAEQKGIDLLFDALPAMLQVRDFSFLILGSGDAQYVAFFDELTRRFPGRVAFRSGYDESLAHLIEAGSDMFLMPSRYEPCGLNQMYSLRYGTIPIVRNTGGLADSVRHFDPGSGIGTGCVFNDYDAGAVRWAIGTALDWYSDPKSWQQLMQNAMAQDFSWTRQIVKYESIYRGLQRAERRT